MQKKLRIGFTGLLGLLAFYLLLWPVPVEPIAFIPPKPPSLTGIYAPNEQLEAVDHFIQYPGLRPEEVAFDTENRIYASTEDGWILRFNPDGSAPELYADTEGKPNGMAFDDDGNLIVADAKKGLLSFAPDGTLTVLATEADQQEIALANDLAIASNGIIYFSDSQFYRDEGILDLMDGRSLSRLLAYEPKTKTTRLVVDGLYYANGVTLGPDESFVLVTESWAYRVTRYWLSGAKQGQRDYFIENLPGLPDNITFNGQQIYWMALYQPRDKTLEVLQTKPFLRKVLMRVPSFLTTKTSPPRYGFVLGLDRTGKVLYNLQDPSGQSAWSVSSVTEHEGMLYFGTFGDEVIKRIPTP